MHPRLSTSRGISVGGPQTVTSAPMRVKAWMLERATRLCMTSPTIQIAAPSSEPSLRRSVNTSSSAWLGCSCLPSPAFTTDADVWRATRSAAPAQGARITIAAGSYADSVAIVSRSDSPLSTLEPLERTATTSAERRLAASSNDELVRVLAS